jgi:hypothetical protein
MIPLKVGTPGRYVRVTQQFGRTKERIIELQNVVELEDVTTLVTDSINPTMVEEEKLMDTQV